MFCFVFLEHYILFFVFMVLLAACVYVCMLASMYTCVHVCMCVSVHASVCVCVCLCASAALLCPFVTSFTLLRFCGLSKRHHCQGRSSAVMQSLRLVAFIEPREFD